MKAYLYLMRLHRPIPILLILYPTLWGLFAANNSISSSTFPNLKLFSIFILGVIIMRTVGCIFNDIADRNFDIYVKRTAMRPLATGEINIKNATTIGLVLLFLALFLVLQLNLFTIILSMIAVTLALVYPLFKRFFSMPQLILGLAFNFGIIMSYTATLNYIPLSAWILYFAAIFWTISYDTMYALADKDYDINLGLYSSAITFANFTLLSMMIEQSITLLLLIFFAYIESYNYFFYLSLIITAILFCYQHITWRKGGIDQCVKAFSNNHWIGLTILVAILIQ